MDVALIISGCCHRLVGFGASRIPWLAGSNNIGLAKQPTVSSIQQKWIQYTVQVSSIKSKLIIVPDAALFSYSEVYYEHRFTCVSSLDLF